MIINLLECLHLGNLQLFGHIELIQMLQLVMLFLAAGLSEQLRKLAKYSTFLANASNVSQKLFKKPQILSCLVVPNEKVIGLPKSLGCKFQEIHIIVVEVLQPKWWINHWN